MCFTVTIWGDISSLGNVSKSLEASCLTVSSFSGCYGGGEEPLRSMCADWGSLFSEPFEGVCEVSEELLDVPLTSNALAFRVLLPFDCLLLSVVSLYSMFANAPPLFESTECLFRCLIASIV